MLLTLVSFFVVAKGANDEPYFSYEFSDWFTQVVVGLSLMAVWGCLSLVVFGLVIERLISPLWLLLWAWAAICVFYLLSCPFGYWEDMERIGQGTL